jgi:hypothetical protein
MTPDPPPPAKSGDAQPDDSHDLFGKLESLIQKHQGRALRRPPESAPTLTEPVEIPPPPLATAIPVLQDAVALGSSETSLAELLSTRRRQLQVALYLRLRQRLDHELNEALAENLRLGTVAADPAFSRVAQGLRAMLPVLVRESVEQVFGQELLDTLLASADKGATDNSSER